MISKEQITVYASGNEMAAEAARQIGYDVMGYYPITPSTQIAENLDLMRAKGQTDMIMIAAEGEHSAAGICYGASVGGGRVFNATSANGLMYALEQLPVQSGTRYPMVMNVACRTISGPLSIKGDHSDLMFMLNAGWIIFSRTALRKFMTSISWRSSWQNRCACPPLSLLMVFLPVIRNGAANGLPTTPAYADISAYAGSLIRFLIWSIRSRSAPI